MEQITQKSVGFHFRQKLFFNEHPEFRPDPYCRQAVDEQIAKIDPRFLKEEENEETIE